MNFNDAVFKNQYIVKIVATKIDIKIGGPSVKIRIQECAVQKIEVFEFRIQTLSRVLLYLKGKRELEKRKNCEILRRKEAYK